MATQCPLNICISYTSIFFFFLHVFLPTSTFSFEFYIPDHISHLHIISPSTYIPLCFPLFNLIENSSMTLSKKLFRHYFKKVGSIPTRPPFIMFFISHPSVTFPFASNPSFVESNQDERCIMTQDFFLFYLEEVWKEKQSVVRGLKYVQEICYELLHTTTGICFLYKIIIIIITIIINFQFYLLQSPISTDQGNKFLQLQRIDKFFNYSVAIKFAKFLKVAVNAINYISTGSGLLIKK